MIAAHYLYLRFVCWTVWLFVCEIDY